MSIDIFYTVLLMSVFGVFTSINCEVTKTKYFHRETLDDKVCTGTERIFEQSARSTLACTQLCTTNSACIGVFYSTATLTCTACRGYSNVADREGNIFIMKLNCGPPPPHDHVDIGHVIGRFPAGYTLTYTCTPCTYFPSAGAGAIRCQSDGTWTTPSCVYSPDVGMLSNGQLIQSGSLGCISTFNTGCSVLTGVAFVSFGLKTDGTIGTCWCDNLCCLMGNCCFDADC